MKLLKKLTSITAPSGGEKALSSFVIEEIKNHCENYTLDPLGNLIVFKKGEKTPDKKLMIAAHLDEVGFIITEILDSGLLKFSTIGGILGSVLCGSKVLFSGGNVGIIIPSKATHLLDKEKRLEMPDSDDLFIDIGAENKEDAEKLVSLGDKAAFFPDWFENEESVFSKALDDRIGVRTLIKIIKGKIPYDTTFVFTVQEEVGLRGAATAAFSVSPDIAVVLDATTASDLPEKSGSERVCVQGEGPVVSFMDKSTVYDTDLWHKVLEVAEKNSIPVQLKTKVAGGNDAGSIHKAVGGIRTAAISAPTRYIHSGLSLVRKSDIEAIYNLVLALIGEIQSL